MTYQLPGGSRNKRQKVEFKALISKYTEQKGNQSGEKSLDDVGFLNIRSMPWSVWMELANEFVGPYYTAKNPITK